MKRFVTSLCLCIVALATLMVGLNFTPTVSAASFHPDRPFSGEPCSALPNPVYTGVSYDASSYTIQYDKESGNIPYGLFSNTSPGAPSIGVSSCGGDSLGYTSLYVGHITSTSSYNVRATINGVTTQTTPASNAVYPDPNLDGVTVIILYGPNFAVATDHQYIFQVQFCQPLYPSGQSCGAWSPSVTLITAANRNCQSGYVWRAAAVFDLVCVTPDQRTQVTNDNSQASLRVNPNGAYGPHTCINGYVWRNAFGGDYVCVTPNERTQVAIDNSQALKRIVAL